MNTNRQPLYLVANMPHDHCLGAAMFMSFLQDVFVTSERQWFTKEEVLIILHNIGNFELPEGMVDMVKDASSGS